MKFVSFDGLQGGGKTTQLWGLITAANYSRKPLAFAKRMYNTDLTEEYKRLAIDDYEKHAKRMLELRIQILNIQYNTKKVEEVEQNNGIILTDRFDMSAYTKARALDVSSKDCVKVLEKLNQFPDTYIIPSISIKESIKRARITSNKIRQSASFLRKNLEATEEYKDIVKGLASFIEYDANAHQEHIHRYLRSELGIMTKRGNFIPTKIQKLTEELGLESTLIK